MDDSALPAIAPGPPGSPSIDTAERRIMPLPAMRSRKWLVAACSVALVASVLYAYGWQRHVDATERATPSAAVRTSSSDPPRSELAARAAALPPLSLAAPLLSLPLDGYGPATVAVPTGATEKRPVVVALHAHAVRPEHACVQWQRAAHGWPFVLCPFGLPATASPAQAVTLGAPEYTEREVTAGLAALRARFADYLGVGPPLLVGWSLGAEVAVQIAARYPARFERAAFGEGAYSKLDDRTAAHLRAGGLERVLLLCSTRACETTYSSALARFERVGIATRVFGARSGEHPFEGTAVDAAARAWPWLLADEPRFVR